jgi:integrating conjugative element protein (TIGR03746 family)
MGIRNHSQARDAHIWTLRMALVFITVLALAQAAVIIYRQNRIIVQIPPDLSKGALIKPGEYLAPNAYVFAHYFWRTLNDWPTSGKTDYKAQITTNQCYFTPTFLRWLQDNYEQKVRAGELERARSMHVTQPFDLKLVRAFPGNEFGVDLTMRITEVVGKEVVKNTEISYPLRVVPDNRPCNQMGLALDGFYEEPRRLDTPEKTQ